MLYVVATPIGNLGDISERALNTLRDVDLIAAEDTRQTGKLLSHFNIKKPMLSYYEHNKMERGPELIEKLKAGANIALVSDAGTPGISDPGEDIIKLAIENNIQVTMIPGPVAGIMALVLSGLCSKRFVFEGFLSDDKKKRFAILEELKFEKRTIVLYESPHRIKQTLQEMEGYLGSNRNVVLCRELTKIYEEIRRATIAEHLVYFKENAPRGEYVVVIDGNSEETIRIIENAWANISVCDHVNENIAKGFNRKDSIKRTADERGMSRNDVYAEYESSKKQTKNI